MLIENRNFAFKQPIFANGDVIQRCNLTQAIPGTAIGSGVTGLTFRNCNLVNCTVPGDATVEHCNTAQIERCANLHPNLLDHGVSPEAENCPHVTDIDEIEIGGIVVDTIYTYEDTVL